MEILMAIVDLIPCVLCFFAMWILQTSLYHKMNKYSYALFASGTIMVLFAGVFKAIYKIIYYGFNVDMYRFNYMFFPVQAFGFVLAFTALLIYVFQKKSSGPLSVALLSVVTTEEGKKLANDTMLYVALQIIGFGGIYGILCYFAKKLKKPLLIIAFIVAFSCMLVMGFLSTRISRAATNSDYLLYNWLAEGVNTVAQALFLFGVIKLKKAGLKESSEI